MDHNKRGVFLGTLNIMTAPARHLITKPLAWLYHARYHEKYKRPKHVFAFDLGLVALGAALAVIAIYFGLFFKPFDPIQIQFTAAPKNPVAGGEVVLNFNLSNLSAAAIDNATANFKFPPEIKFLRSSLPYTHDKNTVILGSVDAKTDVTERLVGSLSGQVGKNLKVTANLTYKESQTGKTVNKNAAVIVKISSSSVGADFTLPDNILVGQTVTGSISYFNRGNAPADGIVIVPNWPDGFVLASSQPVAKSGRWELGTLTPGSAGKIDFTGVMGLGGTSADFAVETGIKSGSDILLQTQSDKTVSLTDPQISVKIDGNNLARLGDKLTLTATYKNTGNHTLNGAAVKINVDGGLTIVSGDQTAPLAIKPGTTGQVQYQIRLNKDLPTALQNAIDPQLKVRVALNGQLDNEREVSIVSPSFNVRVASDLGLAAVARYWSESGDQLGRGPLPPEVGKTTRYWIFWNAKNTTGAASNVRVSGVLPSNASFTGKASAPYGDMPEFDPTTRTLTWDVGDIPAFPGVTSPAIGAAFEVALIPTQDQVGTYPTLITKQQITGTDAVTGLNLAGAATDLNAHLSSDPKATTTGTVK